MLKDVQTLNARGTPIVPKCSSKDMDLDWHPFPNIHFTVTQAANRVSCTLNTMEMTVGYVCTLTIAWQKHRTESDLDFGMLTCTQSQIGVRHTVPTPIQPIG